jgi:plasmid stability protein
VPSLNLKISDELMRALRVRSAQEGVSQKELVPRLLLAALILPDSVEVAADNPEVGGGSGTGLPTLGEVKNVR